jgi:alpha-galactosidase/6-phospho-beta-glucosidase family protein
VTLAATGALAHKVGSLDLIVEAAMGSSRRKAVQALIGDPICSDLQVAEKMVNALITAELPYLPAFR